MMIAVLLFSACGLSPITTDMERVEVDVNWGGSSVTVQVLDGVGEFDLGMAHTDDSYVWLGEDCLGPDPIYGLDYCHAFDGSQVTLGYVDDPLQMDEGTSTHFDDTLQFGTTFALWNALGECVAWGHDPSHFGPHGCEPLDLEESSAP